MANQILLFALLAAATFAIAIAFEPSPLQDFCVADPASPARVNGLVCLDPKLATAEHFSFKGLHLPGNTSNPVGSKVTPVNVVQIPGLNTLGVSLARIDYAPYGVVPPHTHPRATEILTVLEGSLYVGFVTSNPNNALISTVLNKGDVFVFPVGLVHFQKSVGYGNAVSISALSSQNPGVNTIANVVFGSKPSIESDVLAKAFQVDKSIISRLQSQF
ncbi:putative germin-like protein 2-1 [Morus notabilis]|uniref:putative germin-like protein 2-1 n=1 Tax=Morus notabilis TaxID=981085 RepID=UPI000CED1F0A|nr:putative germin-like protein 2-1 [Morus notabilis]XP_024022836.1 putative germin-like protein 2-1 [Morus notabilis]